MAIAYKCDISGEYIDEPKNGFIRSGVPITIEHNGKTITLTADIKVVFQVPGAETNQFSRAINNKIKRAMFQEILNSTP